MTEAYGFLRFSAIFSARSGCTRLGLRWKCMQPCTSCN